MDYKDQGIPEDDQGLPLPLVARWRWMVLVPTRVPNLRPKLAEVSPSLIATRSVTTPAALHLYQVNRECNKLLEPDKEEFHRVVMQFMYLA